MFFTDAAGRTWNLALDVAALTKLSGLLECKALDSGTVIRAVYLDLEKFAAIVTEIASHHGEESPATLFAGLSAPRLAELRESFVEEYVRFFPAPVAAEILRSLARLASDPTTTGTEKRDQGPGTRDQVAMAMGSKPDLTPSSIR